MQQLAIIPPKLQKLLPQYKWQLANYIMAKVCIVATIESFNHCIQLYSDIATVYIEVTQQLAIPWHASQRYQLQLHFMFISPHIAKFINERHLKHHGKRLYKKGIAYIMHAHLNLQRNEQTTIQLKSRQVVQQYGGNTA